MKLVQGDFPHPFFLSVPWEICQEAEWNKFHYVGLARVVTAWNFLGLVGNPKILKCWVFHGIGIKNFFPILFFFFFPFVF